MKVRAFSEVDSYSFIDQVTQLVKKEILKQSKEYILGVDEEQFKTYLLDKFTVEPLEIYFSKENISYPQKTVEWVEGQYRRNEKYETTVYTFKISYPFTGDSATFKVKPNAFLLSTEDVYIDDYKKTVSFFIRMYDQNPEQFNSKKTEYQRRAFANYPSVNQVIHSWNDKLKELVQSLFHTQKEVYLKENNFFEAVKVKIDPDTKSVFAAPTVQRKIIPQPSIAKNKEFSSEPTVAKEVYEDILKVIYDSGKSMEKKPALYQGKDEEGLRDQFLFILETRYVASMATGETFNRGGKTDIILKYANDGSNLFVAECKFWHGSGEFLKAISQLFDRYLTWRDSKVALIMFVTNKEFTSVLQTVETDVKKHEYFIRAAGKRGESSFSYIFCLPQDKNKAVFFEIILFHYDK